MVALMVLPSVAMDRAGPEPTGVQALDMLMLESGYLQILPSRLTL